jgi:uncharacterized membrane protein YccC
MVTVLAIWAVLATLVAVFFWWCWGDDNQHLSDAYRNLLTDFNKVCDQRDDANARWNEIARERDKAIQAFHELDRRWEKSQGALEKVVKYMSTEPKGE